MISLFLTLSAKKSAAIDKTKDKKRDIRIDMRNKKKKTRIERKIIQDKY